MYVYSGECRLCEVGVETDIKDWKGDTLYTGDIVICHTEHYNTCLTVVVGNQFQTYSNGTHEDRPFDEKYIQGLKGVRFEEGAWLVSRVKSFSDVVDGEHWKDFGFRYSNE